MKFGVSIFVTHFSAGPAEIAAEAERLGAEAGVALARREDVLAVHPEGQCQRFVLARITVRTTRQDHHQGAGCRCGKSPAHVGCCTSSVPSIASCGRRVASTLSMERPSMSTISSFQPSQITVSVTLGRRPVSSIIMPLRVW